jgi:hypothetical protein
MHIAILDHTPRHSQLIGEIFSAWGAAVTTPIAPAALRTLSPATTPVLVVPADCEASEESLVAYANAGGTVIAILPTGPLLHAAGLTNRGKRDTPTAMRWSAFLPGGFEGETCPIIGEAIHYEKNAGVESLAHFVHPHRYEEKSVAITRTKVGNGAIVCIAFDLPRCIMLMRQGDPALAEWRPNNEGCARPSHMAARFEAGEASWMPFVDLIGRAIVQLAVDALPFPCPTLNHMPGTAAAVLLFSGDEDAAPVAASIDECDYVTEHGGRMDLYIIASATHSTADDAKHYLRHHDLGPHPDLRSLDGAPIADRLALLESEIKLFTEKFGVEPLTVRQHCTAWAGYMEHIEVLEKCGVKMDSSYFTGRILRGFDSSPYGTFGSAIPMKFTRPDGRLINVYQQHIIMSDDVFFAPDEPQYGASHYSFNYPIQTATIIVQRLLREAMSRFHVPVSICIHPGNWATFSRPMGELFVQLANKMGIPIWSHTQWCKFWMARATWRVEAITWNAGTLTATFTGTPAPDPLSIAIPCEHRGQSLTKISVDGSAISLEVVERYRQRTALVIVPQNSGRVTIDATYA